MYASREIDWVSLSDGRQVNISYVVEDGSITEILVKDCETKVTLAVSKDDLKIVLKSINQNRKRQNI